MIKMKKVLALVCALVLMLLPLTAMAATTKYVSTGNSGKLNVRSAPQTHTDNVIAKLENGTRVVILEYLNGNTWVKVEYPQNGKIAIGYVQHRYLSVSKPAVTAAKPTAPKQTTEPQPMSFKKFQHVEPVSMTVKPSTPGGYVNLRWGPSKAVAVMTKLYADAQVIIFFISVILLIDQDACLT